MYHLVNKILLIFALIAITSSAPPITVDKKGDVKLEQYEFKRLNDKNDYSFAYKISDGQARDEVGTFKTDQHGDTQYSVEGSFQFTGPDGVYYNVWYTADENGFHPNGHHLPGATPIPVVDYLSPNAIKSLIG